MTRRRLIYIIMALLSLSCLYFAPRFKRVFSSGIGVAEPVVVAVRLDSVPEPADFSLIGEGADGREYLSPYVTACGCAMSELEAPDASPYEPVLEQMERAYSCNRLERRPAFARRFFRVGNCGKPAPEPVFLTASLGPYAAGWLSGLRLRVNSGVKVRAVTVYIGKRKFYFDENGFRSGWRRESFGKNAVSEAFSAPESVRGAFSARGIINFPGAGYGILRSMRESLSAMDWALPWFFSRSGDNGRLDRAFLSRKINLGDYLGRRLAAKAAVLNESVPENERLFYFFSIERVYIKAPQLQSIMAGAPSIYRSDAAAIMRALQAAGVGYLCFDYMPCFPADIVSPVFEPEFFAGHFEFMETGLHKFYLFRINYDGIGGSRRGANICKIAESGFYSLLYSELKKYEGYKYKLKTNPYPVEKLLHEYEKFGAKYAR